MATGTIVSIHQKGFGFISPDDGEHNGEHREVFFHVSGLNPELEFSDRLLRRRVVFSLITQGGRERAIEVRPV